MGEAIITGFIYGMCACIMWGLGISQLKSKKPVGFYTGEKAPLPDEISDVTAWNRKHGSMWITYGFCLAAAWVFGLWLGDGLLVMVSMVVLLVVPIPVMIWYHNSLIKRYYVKAPEKK